MILRHTPRHFALGIICVLLHCAGTAQASRVIKRSQHPRYILISIDTPGEWPSGTRVCITRQQEILDCGTVAKASPYTAIVLLDRGSGFIRTGDPVRLYQSAFGGRSRSRAARSGVALGIEAGMNVANLSFSDPTDSAAASNRVAFILGPRLDIALNRWIGIDFALLYVEKGTTASQSEGSISASDTLRIDYIELNPHVRFFIPIHSDQFKLSAFTGPFFGYQIKATAVQTNQGASSTGNISSAFNKIDVGLETGIGGAFQISPSIAITLDIQSAFGLINIAANSGTETVLTRGFQFISGIQFAL